MAGRRWEWTASARGPSYTKPVWNWIETTGIDDPADTPTPAQIRAEVWMSLVHGSAGIGYFAHIFSPSFIEAGLLSVPAVKAGVKAINAEITSLAPVLNTPSIGNGATVASQNSAVPVDIMVKRQGGALYVFAVAMRPGATHATFTLRGDGRRNGHGDRRVADDPGRGRRRSPTTSPRTTRCTSTA